MVLSEDTTFQPADARVICTEYVQTFPDSPTPEQWLRFFLHPNPAVGLMLLVWDNRADAVAAQPEDMWNLTTAGTWDADTPPGSDLLASLPTLHGWYYAPILPPMSDTHLLSANPYHDEEIAGYRLSFSIEAVPPGWPGVLWTYMDEPSVTVTGVLVDAANVPRVGVTITFRPVLEDERSVSEEESFSPFRASASGHVVERFARSVVTDGGGAFNIVLWPNGGLVPAGSRYHVSFSDSEPDSALITVPEVGPVSIDDLLVSE